MSEQKLIAESRTFEQQMIERDKRATKAGFVVGGMGLLIAVLALVAVVVMLPLKQTDVELYTLDNHTGRVEHVTRTSKTSLTATEAYQKAMAANYVKVRERYVYPSLQDDYETVQVYNAPQVNDDYLALYAGKNAPDKVYKNGAHTVKVEIHTLEHLFAGFMRNHLNGNGVEIIDISPMGCRTGFYMSLIGTPDEQRVADAWKAAMEDVLKVQDQNQIPRCGCLFCREERSTASSCCALSQSRSEASNVIWIFLLTGYRLTICLYGTSSDAGTPPSAQL